MCEFFMQEALNIIIQSWSLRLFYVCYKILAWGVSQDNTPTWSENCLPQLLSISLFLAKMKTLHQNKWQQKKKTEK